MNKKLLLKDLYWAVFCGDDQRALELHKKIRELEAVERRRAQLRAYNRNQRAAVAR